MKTPTRKSVSQLLLKSKSRNHGKNPLSMAQESAQFEIPPRTHLLSIKNFSSSSLIPQQIKINTTHNLDSPKPTTKTTFSAPQYGSSYAKFIAKPKRISNPSHSGRKITQKRLFSSSASDPFVSDSTPVISSVNSPLEGSTPIDAGSSIRKPISLWPGMYHSPVTNALWEARSSLFEKLPNASENAPAQTELIAKTPSKSRTSILYKFSSDYILREQYRNPWNEIRLGKLLEDLDALAGTISFKV